MSVASVAKRAGRSRWVDRAGRLGYVARGLLWSAVAVLALEVTLGLRHAPPEGQGALSIVADRPLGGVLMPVLAVGFAGHGLWKLAEAIRQSDARGRWDALVRRGASIAGAAFYFFLAAAAVAFTGGAGSGNEREQTRDVFALPLGRLLVGVIGAAVLAVGLYNAYCSVTGRFRKQLREQQLSRDVRGWVIAIGVVGHAARAVIFALVGIFLARASIQYDPSEAKGLDGALRKVLEQPYGEALLGAVGAGLLCYALFCFVAALYARS